MRAKYGVCFKIGVTKSVGSPTFYGFWVSWIDFYLKSIFQDASGGAALGLSWCMFCICQIQTQIFTVLPCPLDPEGVTDWSVAESWSILRAEDLDHPLETANQNVVCPKKVDWMCVKYFNIQANCIIIHILVDVSMSATSTLFCYTSKKKHWTFSVLTDPSPRRIWQLLIWHLDNFGRWFFRNCCTCWMGCLILSLYYNRDLCGFMKVF